MGASKRYARGSRAWGECARSGQRMLLRDMVQDGQIPRLWVHPDWWEPRHPQESLPEVSDAIALRYPSPELNRADSIELPPGNLFEDDFDSTFP